MISVSTILIMIKNAKSLSPIPNFYSWLLSLRWLSCPDPTACHTVYIHQLSKLSDILNFNPVFYWWYSQTYEHSLCHHVRLCGNIKKHKAPDPSDRIQLKSIWFHSPRLRASTEPWLITLKGLILLGQSIFIARELATFHKHMVPKPSQEK